MNSWNFDNTQTDVLKKNNKQTNKSMINNKKEKYKIK